MLPPQLSRRLSEKPPAKHPVKAELGGPTPTPVAEPPQGVGEINSSTHARLVRKMEKLDVASFPHMTKLWNGNRKEYDGQKSFI